MAYLITDMNLVREILSEEYAIPTKIVGNCTNCGVPFHRVSWKNSRLGGIYSKAGLKEQEISGLCEYCYDGTSLINRNCPSNDCNGMLLLHDSDDCACHIYSPCEHCVSRTAYCPKCGWEE